MNDLPEPLQINLEQVLASKSKTGRCRLPRPIVRLFARLIHQDEINALLKEHADKTGVAFAEAILGSLGVSCRVHGAERLDSGRRYVLVCNHPLGGLDGMILIATFGRMFPEIRFVVNDLLMHLEPLRELFVPVDKFGALKHGQAERIREAFASDAQMLYFPAGLCSRLTDGRIQDLPWKKTFVTKALESGRDIVPLYFDGRNSGFFYRLEYWRKRLGIRFNIGTLLLPHEMFRQRGAAFDLYVGEPVEHGSLAGKTVSEWVRHFRRCTYSLKPKD